MSICCSHAASELLVSECGEKKDNPINTVCLSQTLLKKARSLLESKRPLMYLGFGANILNPAG